MTTVDVPLLRLQLLAALKVVEAAGSLRCDCDIACRYSRTRYSRKSECPVGRLTDALSAFIDLQAEP